MGTQTPAKPISAGVTFNDVISQNPAAWAAAPPEEKNALADAYFVKHVATQEGFDKLAPEQRLQLKTQFNQKYNVGTTGNNVNPFDKVTDIAQIGAESLLDPAIRAITANQIQPRTQQEALKRYPGIQTDPGLLGEAYRLHQNPIVQGAGSILGAMGGTAAIARQLPVAAARFAGGVLPTGLFSGATNATDALQGNQSPMQAIGNTVMQTAAAPFQRAGRIGNALLQGGVGYVSGAGNTLFNEAMTGQPINWQQANSEGMKQALLGAGIGAALPGARPQTTVKNPPIKVGKGPAPRMRVVPEVETQANQIARAIEAQRQAAINKRAIDERAQLQARRDAVKTLYAKVANTVDPNAPPQMQAAIQKSLANLKAAHDNLNAEYTQKYGKPKPDKAAKEGAHTETPAPRREAKSYTDKPPVNALQAKATIEKAIAEGKAITVEHRANKAGTRDGSTWREKFDLPYAMVEKNVLVDADGTPLLTANGNPMSATTQKAKAMIDNGEARIIAKPAVRVINENGQVSYRYLEDMYGTVRISKNAHPYNYRLDEDGKLQIFNAKGEPIEQVKANLTKDSEIEAAFSKMQGVVGRVNKGQKVSAEEVLRAAEDFEKTADLERAYNKLKPEAQKNLHKKLTGEDCN